MTDVACQEGGRCTNGGIWVQGRYTIPTDHSRQIYEDCVRIRSLNSCSLDSRRSVRSSNPQSWNRYTYVLGDPINGNDPTGLDCSDLTSMTYYYGEIPCDVTPDLGDFSSLLLTPQISSTVAYPDVCGSGDTVDPDDGSCDTLNPALQTVGALINQINPGGFLNAFMGASVLAGVSTGAALVEFGEAFLQGVIGANSIMLGSGTSVNAATGMVLSGYVEIGGIVGAATVNIPTAVWQAMTPQAQDGVMTGFIDTALMQGLQITFANNPALAAVGSGLAFEYNYITQTLGLQIVQEGTSWVVAP